MFGSSMSLTPSGPGFKKSINPVQNCSVLACEDDTQIIMPTGIQIILYFVELYGSSHLPSRHK